MEQLQKVSTAAYQAAAAAGPADGEAASGDGDHSDGAAGGSPDSGTEEVVEGEYKEA